MQMTNEPFGMAHLDEAYHRGKAMLLSNRDRG